MSGQWAFALWDARRRELVLARDPFGVRPLYIAEHAGRLAFASEIKALFAGLPELPRALDPVGLDETLSLWTVVAPRTMFRGVEELPPGHVRRYCEGRATERAYTEPSFPGDFPGTLADAADAVEDALARATRLRLARSDVPVGCYVSGGLDSSLVAALARAEVGELHTFSLRFADPDFDETAFQRLAGRAARDRPSRGGRPGPRTSRASCPTWCGTPSGRCCAPRRRRCSCCRSSCARRASRSCSPARAPTRCSRATTCSARARSAGSGRAHRTRGRVRCCSRGCTRISHGRRSRTTRSRAASSGRDLARWREPGFAHGPRWAAGASLRRLLAPDMRVQGDAVARLLASRPAAFDAWSPLAQDQYLEIRTLLSGYLLASQGDRMAMASSVEGRFPFLDRDVVALACSLPDRFKLRTLDEKHVLKRVATGRVPAEIVARAKQPYRAPDCFAGPDAPEWVHAALADAAIRAAGVFDAAATRGLVAKCRAARGRLSNTDQMALVAVLTTQLLVELFISRAPQARLRMPIIDRTTPHANP